jgi:hypothetical protein
MPVQGTRRSQGIFTVESPFASLVPATTEAAVLEADPTSAFGYLTAAAAHGLTLEYPRNTYALRFASVSPGRVPLGTTPEEWLEYERPLPVHIRGGPTGTVTWVASTSDFGVEVRLFEGLPVYVTDLERTLLDGLHRPDLSGGVLTVFRAWREAREKLRTDLLVKYVEQSGRPLMRQRVGFLLEALGIHSFPAETWRECLRRGGSMRLVPGGEYGSTYSSRWNLGINVDPIVLRELTGGEVP